MKLTCRTCGSWNYTGRSRDRATCPKCKGKVRIAFDRKYQKKLRLSTASPKPAARSMADVLLEALDTGQPGSARQELRSKPAEIIMSTDARDVINPLLIELGPDLKVYKGRRAREKLFGKQLAAPSLNPLHRDLRGPEDGPVFGLEVRKVVIPEKTRWPYIL